MKTLLTLLFLAGSCIVYAQGLSYEEYQSEAKINKRLLPKYGSISKSEDEKAADKAFIEKAVEEHSSAQKASIKMVEKGYHALEDDPKGAMYHFNQAYLLDSSNANIFWGYGKLYVHFQQFEIAKNYFEEGLSLDPKNTMLLNALAENHQAEYESNGNDSSLTASIQLLQRSFRVNPSNPSTSKLLTTAYLEQGNCEKAKKFYQVYLAAEDGKNTSDLMGIMEEKCKSSD